MPLVRMSPVWQYSRQGRALSWIFKEAREPIAGRLPSGVRSNQVEFTATRSCVNEGGVCELPAATAQFDVIHG